jgi:chromosome segregation ATPase
MGEKNKKNQGGIPETNYEALLKAEQEKSQKQLEELTELQEKQKIQEELTQDLVKESELKDEQIQKLDELVNEKETKIQALESDTTAFKALITKRDNQIKDLKGRVKTAQRKVEKKQSKIVSH